jgi:hypothetical protein
LALLLGTVLAPAMSSAGEFPFLPEFSRVTRTFVSFSMISKSRLDSIRIHDIDIDHQPTAPARVWRMPSMADGYVKWSILHIDMKPSQGPSLALKWHTEPSLTDPQHWQDVVVDDFKKLAPGAKLEIAMWISIRQQDGYFVSFKEGVKPRDGFTDFSGCFQAASGVRFSTAHNDGVSVEAMRNPGRGYHGWCYKYRAIHDQSEYYLHYFAASSAESWKAVAAWESGNFKRVMALPARRKGAIVRALALKQPGLSQAEAIGRITTWMNANLRYLEDDDHRRIPASFDEVVSQGAGDCKGRSLVMAALLREVGIPVHFLGVNSRSKYALVGKAPLVTKMDHVALYLPDLDKFIDTSDRGGPGMVGGVALDFETGEKVTIH